MLLSEGAAKIKIPDDQPVFFNQRAKRARDLGVLALKVISQDKKDLTVLDVFSGSGIRGIRYALEVKNVSLIVFNDSSSFAIETLKENIKLNDIQIPYRIYSEEARTLFCHLQSEKIFFDFVDLDAFGTPVLFFDHVFRILKRKEAYVYITSTDTATLCGIRKKAAIRNYASITENVSFCHEVGARIVIKSFIDSCGRQGYSPEVMFTFFDGTGIRILFKVKKSREEFPQSELSFIAYNPETRERFSLTHKELHKLTRKFLILGPLYTGKIHNQEFLLKMRTLADKQLKKLIIIFLDENELPPYFYDYARICKKLKVSMPPLSEIIEELKKSGYRASRTHFSPRGIKTDAPIEVIKEIISALNTCK